MPTAADASLENNFPPSSALESGACEVFDRLLVLVLNRRLARWSEGGWASRSMEFYRDRVRYHGLALLVWDHREALEGWPMDLLDMIHDEARMQALWEDTHARVIASLIECLDQHEIPAALNKGTALAYSVFSDPAMRQRGDTDLLVREENRTEIRQILQEQGFAILQKSETQEDWEFDTGLGFRHVVDVHWRANSSPGMRDIFSIDEALRSAVPLPRLSEKAKAVEPVLLFLSDVLNQAMHAKIGVILDGVWVNSGRRLIWTYGTHLQASAFSDEDWARMVRKAKELGLQRLSAEALERSFQSFGTDVPDEVIERLRQNGSAGEADRYLADMSTVERAIIEWRSASGIRQKFSRLAGHAAPPGVYMRKKYPEMARYPIVLLHLRRLAAGMAGAAVDLIKRVRNGRQGK